MTKALPEDPDPLGPPDPLDRRVDVLIVGSGVAGLSAALELGRHPLRPRTLVATRGTLGGHGASPLAQGGVAVAFDPSDSPELHADDTRAAGAGLARPELVEILTRDGPDRVRELIRIGAAFDRAPSGRLALGLEAAHSRRRILHARGDRTGAEVTRALREAVRSSAEIEVAEQMEVVELLVRDGRIAGVLARNGAGALVRILADAVLLATGGAGRAFLKTTSPPGLNGDGLAMAALAGARLMDLEFVQFHPTALDVEADPLPLMTEALRGAGARLVDREGNPVLDPDEGDELASRDKVARALWIRIREGVPVFLDCRAAFGGRLAESFPGVYALCRAHGVDPDTELVPVTPAAHYHMGGIAVDEEGRSSLPGLWAAGEVSASGVHGANRLASNSLLEGLVFGPRAARSMADAIARSDGAGAGGTHDAAGPDQDRPEAPALPPEVVLRIRRILWEKVGVVRNGAGLVSALKELDAMEEAFRRAPTPPARSFLLVARMITHAALLRTESRGCHFRTDYPSPAPGEPRHSQIEVDPDGVTIRAILTDAPSELEPPTKVPFPA